MKKSLPCLSALASLALATAATAQSAPEVSSDGVAASQSISAPATAADVEGGNRMLRQIAGQLERRASVTAGLGYAVDVCGRQLSGRGRYWQQGRGEEMRLRLELEVQGQDSILLQVSNSRFLWVDRRLPTGRFVTRIDLRQLRADPTLAASNLDEIQPGGAGWSALQPSLTAQSGGLPSMIAALAENFSFLPPQAMLIAIDSPVGGEPTKTPVFAVVGHWKLDRLGVLVDGPSTGKNEDSSGGPSYAELMQTLPEQLPQEVLLLVGQADLFPYRIEYRRLETPTPLSGTGPPIPYQLSNHPMVVMQLSDVAFDVPIAAGQFDYAPGDADWVDQTTALLERLRREHRDEVATRGTDPSVPAAR
jgi:hypothetical protein